MHRRVAAHGEDASAEAARPVRTTRERASPAQPSSSSCIDRQAKPSLQAADTSRILAAPTAGAKACPRNPPKLAPRSISGAVSMPFVTRRRGLGCRALARYSIRYRLPVVPAAPIVPELGPAGVPPRTTILPLAYCTHPLPQPCTAYYRLPLARTSRSARPRPAPSRRPRRHPRPEPDRRPRQRLA